MIENWESKIHQNASADSTVGTMKESAPALLLVL